jgi:hypothetical protein
MSPAPKRRSFFLIFALAGTCASVLADQGAATGPRLRDGLVQPGQLLPVQATDRFDASQRYVLRFGGPLSAEQHAALSAAGVRLSTYLPDHCFVADLSAARPAALANLGFVTLITTYQRSWKLAPDLGARAGGTSERIASLAAGLVPVRATLMDGEPLEPALASIWGLQGAHVLGTEQAGSAWSVAAMVPRAQLASLADVPGLLFAEDLEEFTPRDNNQRWAVQSGIQNVTPLYDHGLTGTGQVVAVIDGWMAPEHCSFLDPIHPIGPEHRKILAYNTEPAYDPHGTHVAGIVAGDPGDFSANRGIAYNAKIVFNIGPEQTEPGYYARFDLHRTQGAFVHTNSWGNDRTVAYDYACRAIDDFMWQNEDQLLVFAVTNSSLLKNPENAKNLLSVGAVGNPPGLNTICTGGRGPTSDGRRRPEIWAPGCTIESASGSIGCATAINSGTSMAAPAVSGIAVLTRQYFTDGFYPSGAARANDALLPSGALLKAMILNSGTDITSAAGYPGDREGWGRMIADASLYFAGDARRLVVKDIRNTSAEALSTGQTRRVLFRISGASQTLRATMCFTDAPAAVNSASAPVNDADLRLISPLGDVFVGNVFENGFSRSGGTPDPINNTEQVHVQAPAAGLWIAEVAGTSVNVGTQGFALVLTGDVTPCPADFDGTGEIDFFDYLEFVDAFSNSDPRADFDHNGEIDFFDYLDFVAAFDGGC